MYKKIILSILLIFTLAGCSIAVPKENKTVTEEQYVKAVWITYYELSGFTQDSTEPGF